MSITKETIFEYFAGRATPLQKCTIKEWLKEKDNEFFFYDCLEEWENLFPQYAPETEKKLELFLGSINKENHTHNFNQSNLIIKNKPVFKWMLAASLSLLFLSGIGFLYRDFIFYKTYSSNYGEVKTFFLEDKSQVTLVAHSNLKIPRLFLSSLKREVWLDGEAFFSVSKQADHKKFIVHTGNLNVEVLGTKFNVTDRRGNTKVILKEGKIIVTSNKDGKIQPYLMSPGEIIEINSKGKHFNKKVIKPELLYNWQENKLVFDSIHLSDVLQTIEDYYGTKIILQDSTLNHQIYTGTLPNNDLEVIINMLSGIYGLEVERTENQIIFK